MITILFFCSNTVCAAYKTYAAGKCKSDKTINITTKDKIFSNGDIIDGTKVKDTSWPSLFRLGLGEGQRQKVASTKKNSSKVLSITNQKNLFEVWWRKGSWLCRGSFNIYMITRKKTENGCREIYSKNFWRFASFNHQTHNCLFQPSTRNTGRDKKN